MRNRMLRAAAPVATLVLLISACVDEAAPISTPAVDGETSGSVVITSTTAAGGAGSSVPTSAPEAPGVMAAPSSEQTLTTTTVAATVESTRPAAKDVAPEEETDEVLKELPVGELASETLCEAAGAAWEEGPGGCGDPYPAGEEVVWRPDLQQEAFEAIDPHAAGADIWYEGGEDVGVAAHRFYRFYHMRGDEQRVLGRSWRRTLDVFWDSPVIYYPVRYDLSWHDHPKTVRVVATWPLGEQRELLVTDGEPLDGIELPPGPPLPATTPYVEPTFPETAVQLGRDCPPVEQLWSLDAPVEDSCTLAAVLAAFQYAYAAATAEQTQAAVRDGGVLAETIGLIKDIANQDSFVAYWFDPANPGHYVAETRNVRWAGRFAGASMISAEYRIYARPGLASPEIQELARQEIRGQVEEGVELSEWALSDELPTGPPPPDEGFWDTMLVVRTADGTWRMSYPMWCFSMERKTLYQSVTCPADPNPVWSDSEWDFDLYPPNHLDFWLNATAEQRGYLGTPPS